MQAAVPLMVLPLSFGAFLKKLPLRFKLVSLGVSVVCLAFTNHLSLTTSSTHQFICSQS